MNGIRIRGEVAPGFEGMRHAFAACLADEPADPGAQLAVHLEGRRVVDLWTDGPVVGDTVTGDSLMGVYSSTKGATALTVALLVQEGVLDLDRRVADHWPAFAAEGKRDVTIRQVLSHQAGVPGVDGGLTPAELADDTLAAGRVAAQRPYWEPGTAYGYHSFTFGAILNEVVRAATGETLQRVYERRVRAPRALDVYLGLPEREGKRVVATLPWLSTPAQEAALAANRPDADGVPGVSYNLNATPPMDYVAYANSRETRANGPSSGGAVASARGLASLYSAAVFGLDGEPPLLTSATLAEFTRLHTPGADLVTGVEGRFALGFEHKRSQYPFLGDRAFGHCGMGGSEAFADPATGVVYAYTRRRMPFGFTATENRCLTAAVLRCLS
ncbi:serine hydrolase domain-containing protein [Actinomadura kijaniata]